MTFMNALATEPEELPNYSWHLSSLSHAELFLQDALIYLADQSRAKRMFAWVPHAWFLLGEDRNELLFHRALSRRGIKMYGIMGGRTHLDYVIRYSLPERIYECSLEVSSFEHQRTLMIFLVEEALLLMQLDHNTTNTIEQIFEQYPTTAEIPPSLVRELRHGKAAITLTLSRERLEIERQRQRFMRALRMEL